MMSEDSVSLFEKFWTLEMLDTSDYVENLMCILVGLLTVLLGTSFRVQAAEGLYLALDERVVEMGCSDLYLQFWLLNSANFSCKMPF